MSFYSPIPARINGTTKGFRAYNETSISVKYRDSSGVNQSSTIAVADKLRLDLSSGYDEQILTGSARFKVGADNFLVKPINYEELQAIINKLLKDKFFADTMETRIGVVNVLNKIMRSIGNKQYLTLISNEWLYAKKLADNLSLNDEAEERLFAAIVLQHAGTITATEESEYLSVGLDLLEDLKLSKWLKPVLLYATKNVSGVNCEKLKAEIKLAGMEVEADILQVVNRFADLLFERQGNVNISMAFLKREGLVKNYNPDILKRLEQIINDEKILSMIK